MCLLHSELLWPPGQRADEVGEELNLVLRIESFVFLCIFREAKIGEKKENRGRGAHRKENKSLHCFEVAMLIVFLPCKELAF